MAGFSQDLCGLPPDGTRGLSCAGGKEMAYGDYLEAAILIGSCCGCSVCCVGCAATCVAGLLPSAILVLCATV